MKPMPSSNKTKQTGDQMQASSDPWANYDPWCKPMQSASQPSIPRKDVSGPTEIRFQQQDERLSKLEQRLKQLTAETQAEFTKVAQREEANMTTMANALTGVKQELETSFHSAITQQSNALNGTLNELKEMLKTNNKRDRDPSPATMRDD